MHGLQFLDRHGTDVGLNVTVNEFLVSFEGLGADIDGSPIAQPAIDKLGRNSGSAVTVSISPAIFNSDGASCNPT